MRLKEVEKDLESGEKVEELVGTGVEGLVLLEEVRQEGTKRKGRGEGTDEMVVLEVQNVEEEEEEEEEGKEE